MRKKFTPQGDCHEKDNVQTDTSAVTDGGNAFLHHRAHVCREHFRAR